MFLRNVSLSGFWLTFGLKHLKRIQGTLLAKPDISGFDTLLLAHQPKGLFFELCGVTSSFRHDTPPVPKADAKHFDPLWRVGGDGRRKSAGSGVEPEARVGLVIHRE